MGARGIPDDRTYKSLRTTRETLLFCPQFIPDPPASEPDVWLEWEDLEELPSATA